MVADECKGEPVVYSDMRITKDKKEASQARSPTKGKMDDAHDIVLETQVEVAPEELDTAQEDDFCRMDEAREAGLRTSKSYDEEGFTALLDKGNDDTEEAARVQRLGRGSTHLGNESPNKGLQRNRSQSQDYTQLLSHLDNQSPVPPSPFKPRCALLSDTNSVDAL
jgi:hypothetical protein